MTENSEAKFRTAKDMDRQLHIPDLGLKTFVDFLRVGCTKNSTFVPCGCLRDQIQYNKAYDRAFKSLSRSEKIHHYYRVVVLLKSCLEGEPTNIEIERPEEGPKDVTLNLFNEKEKAWETRAVTIDWNKKSMNFKQGGQALNFSYYLLRNSSKKDRKAFALESTENFQKPTTLRVSNHKETPEVLRQLLEKLIMGAIRDYFVKTLSEIGKLPTVKSQIISEMKMSKTPSNKEGSIRTSDKIGSGIQLGSMPISFMKKKSLNLPARRKTQQQNKRNSIITLLEDNSGFNENSKGVYYHINDNRVRKVFKIKEEQYKIPLEWFSDNLMTPSGFRNWKKCLREVRTLGQARSLMGQKIFYQTHQFKEKIGQAYLYRREKYQASPDTIYFFDYSVANPHPSQFPGLETPSKIEYVVWKFDRVSQGLIITVEGKIIHSNVKPGTLALSLSDQFIGQINRLCSGSSTPSLLNCISFEEEFLQQCINESANEDDFYSIVDSREYSSQSSVVPYEHIPTNLTVHQVEQIVEKHEHDHSKLYLKVKHPLVPLPKSSTSILKTPKVIGKNPFLEDEFKLTAKGQLVCINTKKIDAQKGILGELAKSFGRNLFGGKSIIDISMPVKIFAYESHLSLLCKACCYGPTLLEKAAQEPDPELRMKYIVGYALGSNNAYVLMDKPFNPILGQTYNCIIDGCPVYGQQISHHPPISSIFMKGRGYTVYGSLESKVSLSINSATGSNAGVMHISFDQHNIKKNVVKLIFPGVEVGGVMWGQRTLKNVDKAQYLDEENRLFLELNFAKHKGITQFCKFENGVEGKLLKLKEGVNMSAFPHMKVGKKDIERECGIICGKWNQFLLYEHENVINFAEEYPPLPEKYTAPLESDAFLRKDLLLRIQQKMQEAQLAKEQLQAIQRNDRKLRQKHAKQN